jgi:hypothetical protein
MWTGGNGTGTTVEPVQILDPDPDIYNSVFTLKGASRLLLMGRIERLRRWNQIAPQESRRRSRLGRSTALAGLACHGICARRLV